jgi:hypothetical protein
MTTTTDRAGYTAGLHALADALEQHPEIPLPYHGTATALRIFTHNDAPIAMAALARVMTGAVQKVYDDADTTFGFDLVGQFHGLRVEGTAPRDQVCERVVKGTREITREVPDPQALAAVPTMTVTETVEDVEWVCRPLLAADGETSDEDRQAAAQVNKAQAAQHYSGLAEQAATL